MTQMKRREHRQPRPGKPLWQLGYIFGTLALVLVLGGSDPQLNTLFSGTFPVNAAWLWGCAAAIVCFWLLQALAYAAISGMVGAHASLWNHLRITLVGEYYSAITPFASGGQPMQIAYYKRYGIGAAKASSILAVRYIGYISAICVCYLLAVCVDGSRILHDFPLVFWLTALGFVINFASIVMVIVLLLRASLVQRVGRFTINLLTKLPGLRTQQEKWQTAFQKGVTEFASAAEAIRRSPWRCLLAFGLMLLSVFCMFSLAYLVYRALGLTQSSYGVLFSMQLFLYLSVSFVPTPGASGATEGGFYLFFSMVFPKNVLYGAMLLWRLFTYYTNLLAGGLLVIIGELRVFRLRKQSGDAQTDTPEDVPIAKDSARPRPNSFEAVTADTLSTLPAQQGADVPQEHTL